MQTPIFEKNFSLFVKRWPKLAHSLKKIDVGTIPFEIIEGKSQTITVRGKQLSSRHNRQIEAVQICQTLASSEPEIVQYGFGLGDVSLEFLKRKELKALHIFLINPDAFTLIMQLIDLSEIISDSRVHFKDAAQESIVYTPFVFIPPELEICSLSYGKIRDRLQIVLKRQKINKNFEQQRKIFDEIIFRNIKFLENDPDVSELFQTEKNRTFCILASGPTLSLHKEHLQTLKQQRNPPVFIALDTAFRTLKTFDIQPDIIVTFDKNVGTHILSNEATEDITLVYSPVAQHAVLAHWKGPRYAFYDNSIVYDSIRKKIKKTTLYSNGSVIHPATDLAIQMGAKEILFFGADFSFPFGRTHASWEDGTLGPSYLQSNHIVLNGHQKSVRTLFCFVIYLNYLEHLISENPKVSFINTSRNGALIKGTNFHPEFTV